MRARKVLELSPRISEAPFFPATFQRVSSSTRTMWSRSCRVLGEHGGETPLRYLTTTAVL